MTARPTDFEPALLTAGCAASILVAQDMHDRDSGAGAAVLVRAARDKKSI